MTITIERARKEQLAFSARRQKNRTGAYRWAHERSNLRSIIYKDANPGESGSESMWEAMQGEARWRSLRLRASKGTLKPNKRHEFCWGASGLPGWGNSR